MSRRSCRSRGSWTETIKKEYFHSALSALCIVVPSRALNALGLEQLWWGCFMKPLVEHCKNPWNGRCRKTDIEVYIYYKGKKLPICRECWHNIAEKDLEW